MAKSEGNFVTINELLETRKFGGREWPGHVLRLAMLKTNYREPIDFSVRKLEEAAANIATWYRDIEGPQVVVSDPDEKFVACLKDDLNTSGAFNRLNELSKEARWSGPDRDRFIASANLIGLLLPENYFALGGTVHDSIEEAHLRSLVDERLKFIREKNWAEADKIRDEFLAQGIQLKDSKDPTTGERVTTWEVKR